MFDLSVGWTERKTVRHYVWKVCQVNEEMIRYLLLIPLTDNSIHYNSGSKHEIIFLRYWLQSWKYFFCFLILLDMDGHIITPYEIVT